MKIVTAKAYKNLPSWERWIDARIAAANGDRTYRVELSLGALESLRDLIAWAKVATWNRKWREESAARLVKTAEGKGE